MTTRRLLASLLVALSLPGLAEKLAADTPMTSTAGATFKAPAGWDVSRADNTVTLTTPEGDSRLTIAEASGTSARRCIRVRSALPRRSSIV